MSFKPTSRKKYQNDGTKTLQQMMDEENLLNGIEAQNLQQRQGIKNSASHLAMFIWIASIFFGFIPALVVFFMDVEDYVKAQAKEALNVFITLGIYYLLFNFLGIVLIELTGGLSLLIFMLAKMLIPIYVILCIIGVVNTAYGRDYYPPFVFHFFNSDY